MDWIGALTSLGSGVISYLGADKAADAASDAAADASAASLSATRAGIESQERMFDKTQLMSLPWRQVGQQSLERLFYQMTGQKPRDDFDTTGINPIDPGGSSEQFNFGRSPGYDWRLNQGIQAVNRGASAAGQLDSGVRNKDLTRFGQGLASDEYANAYNRWETQRNFDYNTEQNYLNRLAAMSGVGQTAAAQTGQAASIAGNSMNNAYQNMGNNQARNALYSGDGQASGYINMANAGSNLLNNLYGMSKM